MKIYCISIKILSPIVILLLGFAIWANTIKQCFVANVFLALFGSGALLVISSIIGYCVERRFDMEQFYSDVRQTLKKLTQYSSEMSIDKKIDFFITFYNYEQSDIDMSFGRLYFFWNNTTTLEYIYDYIYNPINEVRKCIRSHYWHFRWHEESSDKIETQVRIFISEIESYLLDVKEGMIGNTQCKSVKNRLAETVDYELVNRYYALMYGKRKYKKNGGKLKNTSITKYMRSVKEMADIKFEITKHIGVLSESAKGWTKEINLVSWNDREAKYDIREWSPEHDKMGKGVTLSDDEIEELKRLLEEEISR